MANPTIQFALMNSNEFFSTFFTVLAVTLLELILFLHSFFVRGFALPLWISSCRFIKKFSRYSFQERCETESDQILGVGHQDLYCISTFLAEELYH
jgi:hypothetical protein